MEKNYHQYDMTHLKHKNLIIGQLSVNYSNVNYMTHETVYRLYHVSTCPSCGGCQSQVDAV